MRPRRRRPHPCRGGRRSDSARIARPISKTISPTTAATRRRLRPAGPRGAARARRRSTRRAGCRPRNGSTRPRTSTSLTNESGVMVISLSRIAVLTSVICFGTEPPSVGANASSAFAATTVASVRFRNSVSGLRFASLASMLLTASAKAALAGGVPSAETTIDSISGRALTSSLELSTMPFDDRLGNRQPDALLSDRLPRPVGEAVGVEQLPTRVEEEPSDERQQRTEGGERDRRSAAPRCPPTLLCHGRLNQRSRGAAPYGVPDGRRVSSGNRHLRRRRRHRRARDRARAPAAPSRTPASRCSSASPRSRPTRAATRAASSTPGSTTRPAR